ncbi:hypothetical protein FYC62_08855 [Pedobacter aquae]|uniref:DUF5683 domain-containing protein n=1 Tax=Pedobacter aquae TaxID=2605747 RepID=A0A5C0VIZ9_9SPHI|nr:DUF5683 domain-containing protein [Pedobacter aquae]QEK51753.1 hypothetical protein FYC62_08855 [Pedobacter aquae]
MLKPLFFAILLCSGVLCLAQNKDTVSVEKPKIFVKQRLNRDVFSLFKDSTELQSPRKAVLRSAIIPGWGQARNGKWWKVPLVYGGFVGIGLVYDFNQRLYKEFLGESQARSEGRKELEQYFNASDVQIYSAKDFYRRNRDLSILAFVGFYGINMIDAYIDARLATFDVDDDLAIKISPSIYTPVYSFGINQAPVPMLKLTIKL